MLVKPLRKRFPLTAPATGMLFLAVACGSNSRLPEDTQGDASPKAQSDAAHSAPQTTPAGQPEGAHLIQDDGCTVYQQTKQEGAYTYVRWYTPGGSENCEAWLAENNPDGTAYGRHYVDSNGSYYSAWRYSPQGGTLNACVDNQVGQLACGQAG